MKTNFKGINKIFDAKQKRRKKLARLPITEKVRILIELQKIASPILVARGIYKKPWML